MRAALLVRLGTLGAALLAGGCSSITNHRGYITDEVLLDSVHAGIDNQASVRGVLGTPTYTSSFGEPVWYYVSSQTAQAPFTVPHITQHTVFEVHFDPTGNVSSVERHGMAEVVRIDPDSDKTPTLGRERGFLEDLFGNIGVVGAPGAGGSSGGGGNGGD